MILFRASSTHAAHNSQTKQSGSPRFFVWFIVDLIIMILTTVGAVILIHKIPTMSKFFIYVEYILLSVTGVLIIVFIFVRKIRSNYLATRMVLETVVLLWSVIFAIVFKSTEWTHELISLGITIAITILAVILSWKLSPLNRKGFIVFISISIAVAVLAIIAVICYYFFCKEGDLKGKISCFAMVVLIDLFIIIIMFTCVSVHLYVQLVPRQSQ
uniref:Uncharacterized protein n=1 Tax=Trichobilharzia regenti TaxID=157069 RepID=A0AA85J4N0_TRIRE|nr:unnamed protein product [Trichobilharzia regenti]